MLQTNSLTKKYKNFQALNGLTMNVPKGSIYGFVGKNGAGKTTLIRLICGLQEPTSGDFTLYGIRNDSKDIIKSRRRMGAVVETPSIYMDMTAEENLKQQYLILGLPSYEGIPELLKLVGLENTGKKKAKNFSLGMKQRLGIAIALTGDPDFLVLDEPVNGLDPQGIVEMRELILKLNRERQITVLISSHILDELSRLATHYGIIDNGRMVKELSAEELDAACRKSKFIGCIFVAVGFAVSFAALYTVIGSLSSNKAMTIIYTFAVFIILVMAASALYDRLSEPEMHTGMTIVGNQFVEMEPTPNPLYLSGATRTVCEVALELLPTGQALLLSDVAIEYPVRAISLSVVFTAVTLLVGSMLFRRKDIK